MKLALADVWANVADDLYRLRDSSGCSWRDDGRARADLSQMPQGPQGLPGDPGLVGEPGVGHVGGEALPHLVVGRLALRLVRLGRTGCQRCGFGARAHHWQCPSCKQWGTIKPLHSAAGD